MGAKIKTIFCFAKFSSKKMQNIFIYHFSVSTTLLVVSGTNVTRLAQTSKSEV